MRIAITLPEELLEAADALAARLGISRSELYATAIEEYVARHRDEDVTAHLNRVYREQDSGMDPALRRAQGRSVRSTTW